jgi:hypothetical protein
MLHPILHITLDHRDVERVQSGCGDPEAQLSIRRLGDREFMEGGPPRSSTANAFISSSFPVCPGEAALAFTTRGQPGPAGGYSHSMVAGGFEEMSYTTRLTPATSAMIRLLMRSSTSEGSFAQSAVIASSLVTARITIGCA